jgi:hypothetical protein
LENGVQERRESRGGQEGEEEVSNPPSGTTPDILPLWNEAEEYYQRWKNEEFDIDGEKAKDIHLQHEIRTPKEGGGWKSKEKEETSLLYLFTNAFMNWPSKKLLQVDWIPYANEVVYAFTAIRAHGCLLDGRNTKGRLAQKDNEIKALQQRLEDTTKKLGVMEDRLSQCADEKIGLENTIKEQKERIDSTRAEDIKASFGSEKSKTEG